MIDLRLCFQLLIGKLMPHHFSMRIPIFFLCQLKLYLALHAEFRKHIFLSEGNVGWV